MTEIDRRIAKLSPAKRALLEQKLKQKAGKKKESQRIPKRSLEDAALLSSAQVRMWFLAQLEQENPAYNRPSNIRLKGALNVAVLERSLQGIIRRHDVLRTFFSFNSGKPIQIVVPEIELSLPLINLSNFPEPKEKLERLAKEEAQRPFDVSKLPLFRATLVCFRDEEHFLLLTFHHIIFDGWSMGVFLQELAALYNAFSQNLSSPLPELPIQYGDFAVWQQQRLQGEHLQSQLKYWKRQLGGQLPVLELPTDRPRESAKTFRGAKHVAVFPKALSTALKALSQREGVTLFMTLLAAFQGLLHRYTRQEDVIVGTPIAGRDRAELEPLIGVFINTLVLRGNLSGNPTFRDFLQQMREVALGAYKNQELPFEKVVEVLKPERTVGRTSIFQVLFQLRNLPNERVEIDGLSFEEVKFERGTAALDLALDVVDKPGGLACTFVYNCDLFEAETVERMAGHFQTFLESVVANPTEKISEISLVKEQGFISFSGKVEKIEKSNTFDRALQSSQLVCIHEQFEAQVERTPDAIAVRCGMDCLTYRELNQKANQLAHYLQGFGVKPEVRVGICTERSLEMVVGILGVLKAGGAYIPLDPAYPQDRVQFVLEETQVSLLLTQEHLRASFSPLNLSIFCLDTEWEKITSQPSQTPESGVTPDNLAYIMYTSGSTGKPKGVQIAHANIAYYIPAVSEVLQVQAEDVYLHVASFSFSSSVRQLMVPLCCGATCVIATREQTKNPLRLFDLIQTQKVTVFDGVPSIWHYGLQALDGEGTVALQNSNLRAIALSGDLFPTQLYNRLRDFFSGRVRCFNIYGQTETIGNCAYAVPEDFEGDLYVPVGFPYPHNQAYILNEALEPVAPGEVGELHMAGGCVNQRLTARQKAEGRRQKEQSYADKEREKLGFWEGVSEESIVQENSEQSSPRHFFASSQGKETINLFKTGDLARFREDGAIEVLGRMDFQVKLRGMRVELGEIESTLLLHPQVKVVVVVAREHLPGERGLVAYVVPQEGNPTIQELQDFLTEKLPDYMVPFAFVLLDAFPLTPNGKLDRNALPPVERTARTDFVTPRTPTETKVAAIWAEILELECAGIEDNFFALGGHSLLATLAISRLREVFSVELSFNEFFEFPTVAALSEQIDRASSSQPTTPIPHPTTDKRPVPLTLPQERLWLLDRLAGGNSAYNLVRAMRLQGKLDISALERAIAAIIERHEVLRTSIRVVEGKPVPEIAPTLPFSLPVLELQGLPEGEKAAEVRQILTQHHQQPFNLEREPLWRVRVLQLKEREFLFLFAIHHIIADGWSIEVFWQELSQLYSSFSHNTPPSLSELPIQYGDFARWQRQYLEETREVQLDYWQQQLAGMPPSLDLPTDRARHSTTEFQAGSQPFTLTPSLTGQLKGLARESGSTLFMTLLAGLTILLSRYSNQTDILVGSPIATRNLSETRSLIGFFVNTLILRTDLSGNPTIHHLIDRVKQMTLEAYSHPDIPFEELGNTLNIRHSGFSSWFQVMFILQNVPKIPLNLPDITVTPVALEKVTAGATFDLTLAMEETEMGLSGALEYNANLFDGATIARMVEQFQRVLTGMVEQRDRPVSELSLFTVDQRQPFSQTQPKIISSEMGCIHPLFEAQVEKTPDAIAVQWENQSLTYQELNEKANQLARYLQGLGVEPEVLVGICVERSLDLLVGILGILKAGGAYVPLDPAYPQTRLDYMVADAKIGILVAQDKFVSLFSDRVSHTICLDSDWETIATEGTGNIESAVEPDNLAYVIYTSGSTGNPKGVAIAHRSLVHFTRAAIAEYEITSRDRILQFSSLNFDASVEEIYPCLVTGATLVLRTEEMLRSIPAFLQHCREWEITFFSLPTAYWHQLVHELPTVHSQLPQTLRLVAIGGERAIPEQARMWQKWVGDYPQLVNAYGPTETTVVATAYKITASTEIKQEVPIGRAIANVQTYILDANLQPVPVGIPGELHIGGMGLARGYLNRPELTAERFIEWTVQGIALERRGEEELKRISPRKKTLRLYKTGDRARYLPDGNIEFLGRIDRQVKIRGFRVELGEIEAILCEYSSVQEAVVIAAEEASGTQRLVGYIVSEERQEPEISELRDFVREKLPDYMIPAAFVLLDSLPLTPSGKIDRRALPEPDLDEAFSAQFIAPRNEIETEIAGIWANVLGRDRVGVCDNFFELGGHSLVAIQVIARIQDAFLIDLPLRTLFESPTVEGLSEVVEQRQIFSTDAEIEPDLRAAIPQPHYDLVTDVVASWVERTPERVAISQGDCARSYSELSHSARALARVLLDLGLQQGDVVAVQGEKSFGFIASLLAVFLGGGVLLTLDSNLPLSRQQLMRKSANVKFDLFVGGENNEQSLNGIAVHPDTGEAIDVEPSVIDLPQLHPNDPAYIFFTSGTTGIPKGVLGCHQGLAHFLHWQRETFNIKPRDRAAQFTGFSFDVLLRDVFLPLTSGATLCIPPKDFDLSAASVLSWLEREKISLLHTVPTLAQSWLGDGSANLSALRWIFFAGEPLTDALVNRWRKTFPNSGQIVNLYGPTETTLAKFFYIVPEPPIPGVQPLGSPLPQTQALIWDENQQLCGKGEAGEIVLRTPFRSLGYVNAPEETQKRFIKNPYRDDAGDLLYRTGDRGRYRQDGLLEILGRIDDQIKIRGIRIEPQEIATVLNQHSAIAQTVILAREDEPGNKRLVAYCMANAQPTPRELRHFLQGQLPEYMIPVAFVLLEALPLTPNGKVDRNALPVPNSSHLVQSENFVAPRNETERTIAEIWNQILGVNAGIFDDFFELGGHSLLATQVIARVREAFAIDLPLRRLFEFPTIAGLSEAVGNATPNILKTLSPIDRADTIPLSFAQQRLWFLDQLEGNTAAYNIPMVLRLQGVLAVDALEKAVNAIAQRHDGLRASFSTRDGFPIQRLRPSLDINLTTLDWRDIPEEEQAERVQQFAIEERAKPFDLERDPLLRVTLLRLKEREYILLLTVHHIVSDGWSMRIIARELAEFYTALMEEKEPNLPELSVQYPDFARWQRQWLQGEVLGTQLQYWKEQLTGAPPLLDLPTDRTRPEVQTFSGGTRSRKLSPTLTQSLKTFSQREGATLFMTLLAAFKLLLSRLAGTEDVVIGTPVAGRTRREFEQLIGFFINTVVLRVRCQGNPTFRDFLHRVRTVALGAYEYQEMPFEKLVEELQPERDRSYNPLFQVWFNMLNLSENRAEFSGLEVEPLARSAAPSKFDLTLYAKETPQGIHLDAVYNANLFDGERMEEMLAQFEHLLAQIVETPTKPIDRFSLVSANSSLPNPQTPLASNPQEPVHRRFSRQAQRLPEQIAVTDAQTTWTYGELNRRANQLANYLRAQGVQKQDVVAIYGDRAASLVLAILSVLKAGAVFTLLDPAYPPSRLLHCVQSANPRAWLQVKNDPLPPELEGFAQNCSIQLQITPDLTLEDVPTDDPAVKIDSDDLAYIPFTSGSTGKPKGILSPHNALSHFLHWHSQTFEFSESDRFSMISGLSHDILMRDIFTPLWVGGTLCIPDPNAMEIPGQLGRWMVENEVSVAHLSPAMGQFLQATPVPLTPLRWVFFGSDVLTQKEIKSIREIAPNAKLANFYGATETPQAMGYFPITDCERERIPIGRGIDDVQLLVLNAQQQLAGVGEVGEIYIRTPYLAKGYLGDAELTKERFLQLSVEGIGNREQGTVEKNSEQSSPHPFSASSQEQTTQCYKTGDFGRYLPDGNVEFIGRRDDLVKIRGFRIELGEVKSAIAQHPKIQDAVVLVREGSLIAYIVPQKETPTPAQLRHFLSQKLPHYSIPSFFIAIDSIPLTPNGKIDRQVLLKHEVTIENNEPEKVQPQNELQRQLVEIWERVLNVRPVGIRDNFFDLGGHSLLAIQLFGEMQKVAGTDIPIAAIFQAPTIEQLADILRQKAGLQSWISLVPVQPNGSKPPFFFHGGAADAMTWAGFGRNLPPDQPFYGLQNPELDGKHDPLSSVEEMAAHCLREIQTLQPHGPYYIGGHCFGGTVAFEMAQQLRDRGETVALLAVVDGYPPKPVLKDTLFLRTKSFLNRWDFLLYKTYYYHSDALKKQSAIGKLIYIGNLLKEKVDAKRKKRSPSQPTQSQKNDRAATSSETFIPYEIRYQQAERTNRSAKKKYRAKIYQGKIALFRAKKQKLEWYFGSKLGWEEFTDREIECHEIPGLFGNLFNQSSLPLLVKEVKMCLEKTQDKM
ncbi:amino acid adenylation domain-containing protein [Lusitaniella coriacea LEGE 07157]|uniref:Amino acid adenylation domain-containing protein n=1 Tax=Lusitaniella coriacea LEGE 07157 TaxID=945747 RepID=A0A8J7B0X4_9CYAN|nr:non-ribosomal peptide synthetase [Lusitaniella coriacea]MBE9115230.1 amino acid adenylation domain-containing protein [Lusitaniella coriacea LEGE 07157]